MAYEGQQRDLIYLLFIAASVVFATLCELVRFISLESLRHNILLGLFAIYAICILIVYINIHVGNMLTALQKYGLFKNYQPYDYEKILAQRYAPETQEV